MIEAAPPEEGDKPPGTEAVSWIEAALQAALGAKGGARPDLARRALRDAPAAPAGEQLESWLEAVAAELENNAAALVPDEMVEAIAARILADRRLSLGAHRRIDGRAIRNLVRRD